MLIKEACECCNLTKKAIEYYEAKGLLQPAILENGYRDYTENEILILKEISVLRRCGIGISEIKEILDSRNKSAALEKYKYVTEVRMQRLAAIQKCMDGLIQDYDIKRVFNHLCNHNGDLSTIKERLVFAFPGNYGLFLSLHFGRFLDEPVDTKQKKIAYHAIVKYLDNTDVFLSSQLSEFLEAVFASQEKGTTAELQSQMNKGIMKAIADTETYLEKNQDEIEQYLSFKASDEFQKSLAGQMQQHMLEFQSQSGYKEVFIENMKILSKSYAAYSKQLAAANEKIIERFPMARNMYDF